MNPITTIKSINELPFQWNDSIAKQAGYYPTQKIEEKRWKGTKGFNGLAFENSSGNVRLDFWFVITGRAIPKKNKNKNKNKTDRKRKKKLQMRHELTSYIFRYFSLWDIALTIRLRSPVGDDSSNYAFILYLSQKLQLIDRLHQRIFGEYCSSFQRLILWGEWRRLFIYFFQCKKFGYAMIYLFITVSPINK